MSEPTRDPIVEGIRAARREIEKEHGGDWDRIAQAMYEDQRRNPEEYVTRKPRRADQGAA
jgi:hypothetical protein